MGCNSGKDEAKKKEVIAVMAKVEDASLTKEEHLTREDIGWTKWTVSLRLGTEEMEFFDGRDAEMQYPDGTELTIPESKEEWEAVHAQYNLSSLSADELKSLFKYILKVR